MVVVASTTLSHHGYAQPPIAATVASTTLSHRYYAQPPIVNNNIKKIYIMKKQYSKPKANRIIIDKQISLVMMTNEGTPPGGPFGNVNSAKNSTPYKC